MIKDNNTTLKLLVGILICLIGLAICMTIDSATETITVKNDQPLPPMENVTILNGPYAPIDNNSGKAISDGKVYTVKRNYATITMTGRPSCSQCARNHRAYKWSTHTYINYCPNCHHYNCLGNKHKWQSRHEQEITCFRCDSDFCVRCGKEKYSWSNVQLRKS